MEQYLESAINNVYQKIDSKDLVAVISQIIIDRAHYSYHYSLSNYFLENKRLYHYGKLYQPNIKSVQR